MAYKTPTPNLGLIEPQPGTGEKIRLSDINTNWDTLDARIGAVPSTTHLQAQITALAGDTSAKSRMLYLSSADNTWAKVWAKIGAIPVNGSATIYFHNNAYSAFSNTQRSSGYPCGTITRLDDDRFGGMFTTTNKNILSVVITDASSSSPGTYTERLIEEYDSAGSIDSQSALFALFDTKLASMSNYFESKFNVSLSAAISPFASGARLMITLGRGANATSAMALIQQAGGNTMAMASRPSSGNWSMTQIITQDTQSPSTVTVTLNTSRIQSGIYARKTGRTVYVYFNNATPSVEITGDTTVATLSVIPNMITFGMCKDISNNDVLVFVDTSGNLKIAGVTGAVANKNIYGTFSYIAST